MKELPQYQAVASNTSGSTPRDLYEDVFEDLEKQVIKILFEVFFNVVNEFVIHVYRCEN